MQETWIQPLNPVPWIQWSLGRSHLPQSKHARGHNYWACALEPGSRDYWVHVWQLLEPESPRACALQQEKPEQREAQAQ